MPELKEFFVDLHVHIGRTRKGQPVKITASRNLTFENIARECAERKGIDVVGIVDSASPAVIEDIEELLDSGKMEALRDGGLVYDKKVTVILASEVEVEEKNGGHAHHVAIFPYLDDVKRFSNILSRLVKNSNLSTQNTKKRAQEIFNIVNDIGGVLFPAHAFTPHKSVYGNCARRLSDIFTKKTLEKIPALELGLSADTDIADRIGELSDFTFLSNSDSHSLPKIGREYNIFLMEQPTYKEVLLALWRREGRRVVANYGMDPKLGKYHRTYCNDCGHIATSPPPVFKCEKCGSLNVTMGVFDRVVDIADYKEPKHPAHRPPYHYQVPLEFVPGIGKKLLEKLFDYFGTEMNILHKATFEDLLQVTTPPIARSIILARTGELKLVPGGGGVYGKVKTEKEKHTQKSLFDLSKWAKE